MNSKIITLISLFVLLFSGANAQGSEAEFKTIKESWCLNSDGSQEYNLHKELTIFTHTAMNSTYGETFITYNPQYQSVKINQSYTIQSDGTKITTPENAFVEVLPRNAQNSPAFNHLIELVVVHTGLDLGATIVLDYTITSKSGYMNEIDVFKIIETSSPVKNYTLSFSVPSNRSLEYQSIATKTKPKSSDVDGVKSLVWNFKNVAANSREPMVGVGSGDVEAILVTSYGSTESVMSLFNKQFTSSTSVAQLAKEIVKGLSDQGDKIRAIISYIRSNIASSALTLEEVNYTLRDVDEVIKTAYGTDAEKIALLSAMLNSVGVEASVAASLIANFENCGLSAIDELLVVANDYRISYKSLAPVATYSPKILKLSDASEVVVSPITPQIKYTSSISWQDDKPISESVAEFTSNFLTYSKESEKELLSATSIKSVDKTDQLTTINASQAVSLKSEGDYILLYLPATRKGLYQSSNYATFNSKRTNNLDIHATVCEEYSYQISTPSTLEFSSLESNSTISNRLGSVKKSVVKEGDKIIVKLAININKTLITPADYPLFRALIVEWNDINTKPILFSKQ